MLKDRTTIDYVVYVLYELNKCNRATGGELAAKLQRTSSNSLSYLRKILSRMSNVGLIVSNGMDGFSLTKQYDSYTLGDILTIANPEQQFESPSSQAECLLKEAAQHIKAKDLI